MPGPTLTPTLNYYDFIYQHPGDAQFYVGGNLGDNPLKIQEYVDTFRAYSDFRAVLNKAPTESELYSARALYQSGESNLLSFLQSKRSTSPDPTADMPPPSSSQSPDTSTSGGTPTSFASKYSPVISTVQIPSVGQSGGSSTIFLILAGLAGLFFFLKK